MRRIGITIAVLALSLAFVVAAVLQVLRYKNEVAGIRSAAPVQNDFVGVFPENLSAINDLIRKTKIRLVVVTDVCAYGGFSAPAKFTDYRESLKRLVRNGVSVEMHVYDQQLQDATAKAQFDLSNPNHAAQMFDDLRQSATFDNFLSYHRGDKPPVVEPKSFGEFLALVAAQHARCVEDLTKSGIDLRRDVHSHLPLFIWLRDDTEAIFSVYNLGHRSREISLHTEDPRLINLLREVADTTNPTDPGAQ